MKSYSFGRRLFQTTALALLVPGLAWAQSSDQIETVVVTAQKRAQDIQTVPITVNAFSGETLRQSNISSVNDLQTITPSLVVYNSGSGASDTTFKIRGVGTTGSNPGLEGAVGTFIDGVYRNRSGLALGDLFDIERIEVLEGPQSTLFGKNTSAGALNILTNVPTEGLSGFAEATVSNYGGYKFDGWVNIPIADTLLTRWDGLYNKRDGFIKEINSGQTMNDRDRYFLKGQALWTPTEAVSLRVIADFAHGNEHCCGVISVNTSTSPYTSLVNFLEAANGNALTAGNRHKYAISGNKGAPINNFQDMGISAELNWQLSDTVKLTNIVAYRDYKQNGSGDLDATGADVLNSTSSGFKDHVLSEELRLSGRVDFNSGVKSLDWLAGVYYTDETIRSHLTLSTGQDAGNYWCGVVTHAVFTVVLPACYVGNAATFTIPAVPFLGGAFNLFQPGTGDVQNFYQDGESWSGFAQGTLNITDKLAVTGGLRYSHDHKSAHDTIVSTSLTGGLFPTVPPSPVYPYSQAGSSNALTGTANIQYFWSDTLMTYASYSRGYKSGGFNLNETAGGVVGATLPQDPSFKPETSDNYEGGIKSKWWNNRLLVNATAFYEKLHNLQVLNFDGIAYHIYNVTEGTSKGFEVQTEAALFPGFKINGSVTYADTRYDAGATFVTSSGTANLVGKHFTNAPLWSTSAGATYSFPIGGSGFTGVLHGDVFYGGPRNTGTVQKSEKRQNGYALANLRATLVAPDDRWEVAAWCQNCTDTRYVGVVYDAFVPLGGYDAFVGNPQVYGVTASVRF